MVNPIHDDNRNDLKTYIEALRLLKPEEPGNTKDPKYKEKFQDYQKKVGVWQSLLNVGRRWQVARNQEDFDPALAKLFDEMGKALSRRK